MTPPLPVPPLLLISDRGAVAGPLVDLATAAFRAGCRWMMVREKDLSTDALAALATEIVRAARPFGAMVLVNGDAVAARLSGADGVHLPHGRTVSAARSILDDQATIGVSAHTLAEAEAAARAGADYMTISPIYPSISKPGYGPPLGRDALARIARAIDVPVIALGGITEHNAGDCLAAGARGVAVMGSVMRSDDAGAATRRLIAAIGQDKPEDQNAAARQGMARDGMKD